MQTARAACAEGVGAVLKLRSGGETWGLAFINQTVLSAGDLGMAYSPRLLSEASRTTAFGAVACLALTLDTWAPSTVGLQI